MADTVQYLMEQMLPELDDMQSKGYFSKPEIKAIVKRRQDFEYRLKRRAALKEDFLRYVEYEAKLDELTKHRRKALGITGKRTVADYAMVRRIHFIFERATRKFGSDMGLWAQWLAFCESSSSARQMSRVVAKALALHPLEAGLWVQAAGWEFEGQGNAGAARLLMQQGLRMCKGSALLWAEYLNMEMLYVDKLRARREVLGLSVPQEEEPFGSASSVGPSAAAANGSGMDAAAAAAEVGVGRAGLRSAQHAGSGGSDSGSEEEEDEEERGGQHGGLGGGAAVVGTQGAVDAAVADAAVRAVLTGAIARVVARNAAAALAADLPALLRLLGVASRYSFPGAASIAAVLREGIERDFGTEPAAWDGIARCYCDPSNSSSSEEQQAQALARYEAGHAAREAAGRGSDPELWQLHAGFLQQRLESLLQRQQQQEGGGEGAAEAAGEDAVRAAAKGAQQLLKLFARAKAAGAADEQLFGSWVAAAQRLGQPKMALKAARAGCEALPASGRLWQMRIELEQQLARDPGAAAKQLLPLVKQALGTVDAQQAPALWMQALQLAGDQPEQLAQLQQALLHALAGRARGPPRGGMGQVAGAFLEAAWKLESPQAARALFAALQKVPPAGGDMYRHMLVLEQGEAALGASSSGGGAPPAKRQKQQGQGREQQGHVRAVFEAALDAYGAEDTDLWLRYAQWQQQASCRGAGDIYWRASKALADPEPFIQQYRQVLGL